ncbi:MAG: divalent metal cation transporter [Conexivisphaerales archaeon]
MNQLSGRKATILSFLSIIGPAWIVMMADVDAPSIVTAGESGAAYGYHMIFILIILIVPLFFIQEAAGRVAVSTGKGLAEIIREHYSRRMAILASLPMFLTDFLSYSAEYAGAAVAMEVFGIAPYISLPLVFFIHALLVFTGSYKRTERILLLVSAVLLSSYVVDAFLVGVDLQKLPNVGLNPIQPYADPSFGYMIAANVGAVIMPWMLFYQAGAVVQKGLKRDHYSFERFETLFGAIASEVLMISIVIVSASIGPVNLLSSKKLAEALVPLAGPYSYILYAIGLGSASFLALVVISLASTWGIAEALGWRRRIGDRFVLARKFYMVYILETLPAMLVPLIFSNMVQLMVNLMVVFVFVTIVPAVLLGLISSNQRIMGKRYLKGYWKLFYWVSVIAVVFTGLLTAVSALLRL